MDVREKLVEIIQNSVGGCARNWAEIIVDGLIAHGVTVQEWISAKDRLPEENDNYLVCCDDSGCPMDEGIWYQSGVVVCAEYYKGGWTWCEGSHEWSLDGIVTHWMPLPQPPKGE